LQFLKNKLVVTLVFLLTVVVVVLNKNSKQLIGINHLVTEYEIPLYLKLYNFYGRHLNYEYLVSEITKNSNSEQDKVIDISKWINNSIKKLPNNVDIVDSHPLTIAERRLGNKVQFSDLLSVMLVYADIDSFFWSDEKIHGDVLTFYKIGDQWSVIDPYYGILFINTERTIASIKELKNNDWQAVTLNFQHIDSQSLKSIFSYKFDDTDQIKEYYNEQFSKIPSQEMINTTNMFDLGGRSYIQNPLGRLKFVIYHYG